MPMIANGMGTPASALATVGAGIGAAFIGAGAAIEGAVVFGARFKGLA